MAGQINIAGTSGSVQLFGNDTIVTDINIYFPPAGGLLFANGNALEATDGTFSGNITAAGNVNCASTINEYIVSTKSTSDSHGLLVGNASGDGDKTNANAWISGTGEASFSDIGTGSITAAGNVVSGGSPNQGSNLGVRLDGTYGSVLVCANGSGDAVFKSFKLNGNDPSIEMTAGGSITSEGYYKNNRFNDDGGGNVSIYINLDDGNKYAFAIRNQADGIVSGLKTDGSGLFGNGNISWTAVGALTTKSFVKVDRSDGTAVNFEGNLSGSTTFQVLADGRIISQSTYNRNLSGNTRQLSCKDDGTFGFISSTRKSKANIVSLDDVSWLKELNPVQFNYRKQIEDTQDYSREAHPSIQYGLIAEEVEPIAPEICYYNETESGKELTGLDYNKLIAPTIKLLQQALTRIEDLEAEVAALRS